MARFKKEIKSNFTVIHNAFVRDMNLGINARGILITMLSLPELQSNGEPWNFTIRGLASILPDGKTKVQSALNELEKHGYLLRRQIIENGRFVDTEYIFSDELMTDAIEAYEDKQNGKRARSERTSSATTVPYPDFQDTEKQDTEKSDTEKQDTENQDGNKILNNKILKDQISKNQSIYQSNPADSENFSQSTSAKRIDGLMDRQNSTAERQTYESIVKENIEYDWFVEVLSMPKSKHKLNGSIEELDELVKIMVDCVCSTAPTIRVNGENMPTEAVKSQFLKLNSEHIQYIFDCLYEHKPEVTNIRAYLITTLYNASITMNSAFGMDFRSSFDGMC